METNGIVEDLTRTELDRLEGVYAARLDAGDEGARSLWWATMSEQVWREAVAEAEADAEEVEAERAAYDVMMRAAWDAAAEDARLGDELAVGPDADGFAAIMGFAA